MTTAKKQGPLKEQGRAARHDRGAGRRNPSSRPRSIIIMVKAGKPVDEMIEHAAAARSNRATPSSTMRQLATIRDSQRRFEYLRDKGIGLLLGIGVSGGERGRPPRPLHHGRRPRSTVEERPADPRGDLGQVSTASRAAAYLGDGGAGHFVKMIHNGIEYGDMQMIAEVYGVMRDGLGMKPGRDRRRSSRTGTRARLNSYLIEITGHRARSG